MAQQPEFMLNTAVDDELYDELVQLAGERIVHVAVWEDSMVDAIAGQNEPAETTTCDMDLYLEGGVYFELYGVAGYPTLESEPVSDRAALEKELLRLVHEGVTVGDVAVDEEDALVLVLAKGGEPVLYLAVGGFVLEEWDELPV